MECSTDKQPFLSLVLRSGAIGSSHENLEDIRTEGTHPTSEHPEPCPCRAGKSEFTAQAAVFDLLSLAATPVAPAVVATFLTKSPLSLRDGGAAFKIP